MRILVTGARGFLAAHLIAELRRRPGARILLTQREPGRGSVACDLRDGSAVRRLIARTRPDRVFHLAGTTRALPWDGLWDAHVRCTVNLMEGLRRLPGSRRPRVVTCGSGAEYGNASGNRAVDEEAWPGPVTPYGASKLSQTLAALSYGRNIDVVVARIFTAVGPLMPEHLALGTFVRQVVRIERGLAPPRVKVGDLRATRDFVDVRDVAKALAGLGERGAAGEIYNVCSGKSQPIGEALEGLIKLSSLAIEAKRDPSRMRRADVSRIRGNPRKLSSRTGWKAQTDLARSLRDMLEWCRGLTPSELGR